MPRLTPLERKLRDENKALKEELKGTREAKADFNKRIRAEGRWDEFSARARKLRDETEGLTLEQAKDRLRPLFPPLEELQPTGVFVQDGTPVCVDWPEDRDVESLSEVIEWVATAIGKSAAGATLKAANAPGPQAWGFFTWARKNPKEFWGLYHKEKARQLASDPEAERGTRRTRHQIEEISNMLDELKREAQR